MHQIFSFKISLYLFIEGGCGAVVDDGRVSSIDKCRGASLAEDHLNCGGKSVNFLLVSLLALCTSWSL